MSISARSYRARLTPFGPDERPRILAELVADVEVQAAARAAAAASGRSVDDELARVRAYAEEIVPQYNARLHHRIAYRLARRIATTLFRVRVGHVDEAIQHHLAADASVIFAINHRSNMDYVLVAFLAAEHVALSFAVGEWAKVWPLDTLIRALGAFFVRRNSNDALYRKVLERYVQLAVAHGVTQAVFLEGGLSRDGRLRPPKLGLLAYATRHLSRLSARDLVIVPVAVNYDRVLEDRTLLRDLDPDVRRPSSARTLVSASAWVAKNLGLYARGRLHRFGYACVNFGPPLSMKRYLDERGLDFVSLLEPDRFGEVQRLATVLMGEIASVIPVTPVSLVSTALLSFEDGHATLDALGARVKALTGELSSTGAHLYIPRQDPDYLLHVGLRMLTLRRLVSREGDAWRIVPSEREVVAYYANSIEHFFAVRDSGSIGRAAVADAPAGGGLARSEGSEVVLLENTPPEAVGRRVSNSVVLVHGLARTARSMMRLGQALTDDGYEVHNFDYPSRKFGLPALVEALFDYVWPVAVASDRLDFVTHSMGGLLVRGVLSRGTITNVGRVVMLAPPNRGSAMASRASTYAWARGFYGQSLLDLRADPVAGGMDKSDDRDNDLVGRLGVPPCQFGIIAGTRSFHPLQPTSYYSSMTRPAGSHDGTVQVTETTLPGMTDFITVNANHTFIMDHDETIRQTLQFLATGRFLHE
jgi:glycerol-3-phosphate O-acyltransferase